MAEKSAASAKPVATVVATKRGHVRKWVWLLVLLVLVAGCGVWYGLFRHNRQSGGHSGVNRQLSAADLDAKVDAAYAKKDYAAAASLIQQQQSAADPALQIKLALAYANQGNYQGALQIFNKLDAAGKLSSGYLETAGEVAVQAKDNKAAIQYYQKAKAKVLAEGSPTAESQAEAYDHKIAKLEAQ